MRQTGRNSRIYTRSAMEGKMIPILAGVAVILILLIMIVIRNNNLKEQQALEASVAASEAESKAERESIEASIEASIAAAAAESKITMEECDIPEVNELVKQYFALRLAGDAEGLYQLFGRDTSVNAVDEELRAKLQAQSSWVRSFDDITVYLLPGQNENEKLGIVTYKINFRRVNTKAPAIMYFYAVKDSEGNWRLGENLIKDTRELISEEFDEAGVQMLIDNNTAMLKKALEEDSDLALMYTSFMNGEIYSEYNLDPDREQQVDLFENPEDSILVGE